MRFNPKPRTPKASGIGFGLQAQGSGLGYGLLRRINGPSREWNHRRSLALAPRARSSPCSRRARLAARPTHAAGRRPKRLDRLPPLLLLQDMRRWSHRFRWLSKIWSRHLLGPLWHGTPLGSQARNSSLLNRFYFLLLFQMEYVRIICPLRPQDCAGTTLQVSLQYNPLSPCICQYPC